MARRALHALWLVALLFARGAFADTRVTLSRDAVTLGDAVILAIDTDQPIASPDLRPLEGDFVLGSVDSSRQFNIDGGRVSASQRFRIELRPRRAGMLRIPPLAIGRQRTAPLLLEVTAPGVAAQAPARASTASTQASAPVFIDTVIDDDTPYVQQAVGVSVRLHYALDLYNGEFSQPEPPRGGSLQPVGNDSRSVRVVDGRQYQVLARHYLLVPERSGALRLPGASFRGEGESGFFGGLFGTGRDAISAEAPARTLQVRPLPAGAGQPWLPARSLSLRIAAPPTSARAGEATDLVVEVRADGATAAQLPELRLEAGDAQVFAEPAQPVETFSDGRPQLVLSRRFSIVPQQPGALRLQLAPIDWWDVTADVPRRAALAPIDLQVAPGTGRYAKRAPAQRATTAPAMRSVDSLIHRAWPWLLAFACLAGLTAWGMRRRRADAGADAGTPPAADMPNRASAADPRGRAQARASDAAAFRRALSGGDLAAIARLLPRLAEPPLAGMADVRAQLADADQRDAVLQLERALWGDGEAEATRAALRRAFARGPRWRTPENRPAPLLPPLYPER